MKLKMTKIFKIIKRIFIFITCIYIFISFILFFIQYNLLYPGNEEISNLKKVRQIITTAEENFIEIENSEKLRVFYAPSKNKKVIVFYHGNKENMYSSIIKAERYYKKGFGILACSYPGYDGNLAKKIAKNIYKASTACVDFLNQKKGVSDSNIILHGYSLGGHFATYVARNRTFNALILLAPLGSAYDIAKRKYPLFPLNLIMKDKLISYNYAEKISSPVYLVHNIYDKVVPYNQGLKIYNNILSKKYIKTLEYLIPGTNGHSNIYDYAIIDSIVKWLNEL